MTLDFITWNVDPEIFNVGAFSVRYYGLCFALAFVVGYKIMEYVYKREGLPDNEVDRVSLYMILGVVIGARLGHVLFYQPEYYFQPENLLEILMIWKGGLASHGAAVGILIALFLYSRKGPEKVRSYMWVLDRIILTIPIGGFFVRLGNLFNSEIYGHKTDVPWGFIFVQDNQVVPRHPTQIYEALGYLLVFFLLFGMYRNRKRQLKPGMLFGLFLILLFGVRFFVEFFKEVQVAEEYEVMEMTGLNYGQLYSIPFILAGIFILIRAFRLRPGEKI